MDFELNEEQKMLKHSARQLLSECTEKVVREMRKSSSGYSEELWREMVKLRWQAMIVPEKYGGEECNIVNAGILLEEMGRVVLPSPFFECLSSAICLTESEDSTLKQELMQKICDGRIVVTGLNRIPLEVEKAYASLFHQSSGQVYVIEGKEWPVYYAHVADDIFCLSTSSKSSHALSLVATNALIPGITKIQLGTISGIKQFEVGFGRVNIGADGFLAKENARALLEHIIPKLVALKCAELVGGTQRVLEMTVDYAKARVAFRHPIGSYQSIQHRAVDMLFNVESSRLLTYQALWLLNEGLSCIQEVAMAKAFLNRFYWQICLSAHQIHGAIAFCEEHPMHLYTKQAKEAEQSFGSNLDYLDVVLDGLRD